MFRSINIKPPWKGVISDVPAQLVPNGFLDAKNVFMRKNRIQTRPKFTTFPAPPDGAIVREAVTFLDVLGLKHTVVLTTKNAYYLTANGVYNLITLPGGLANLSGTSFPYGLEYFNDKVYFCNGSTRLLYVEGEADAKEPSAPFGGCRYLSKNAAHLLAAYTVEPGPNDVGGKWYPRRVRWSKTGDGNVWTGAFSSGFAEMYDLTSPITGLTTLGRASFVYGTDAIIQASPTGLALKPFDFEIYSVAPAGVGNLYPYALDSWNNMAVFPSRDDIYVMTPGEMRKISGGRAKKKIFDDLALASGDQVCGWLVPHLGKAYDFLSYWLSVPGINVTWVYNFEDDNWTRVTSAAGRLTHMSSVAVS